MVKTSLVEVTETRGGKFVQQAVSGEHRFTIDEPLEMGGDNAGPGPYEYLLAALGACTSMTLRMVADRKDWPLEQVHVRLTHRRVHVQDCAECADKDRSMDEISREIILKGPLSEAQRQALLDVAGRCPVARTLTAGTRLRALLAQEDWQSKPWEAD